jgi:hypothetical protein
LKPAIGASSHWGRYEAPAGLYFLHSIGKDNEGCVRGPSGPARFK